MAIINHGVWTPYTPSPFPEEAPPSALFFKSASGMDWYSYRSVAWPMDPATRSDTSGTLKIILHDGRVAAFTDDAHALPLGGGGTVLEAVSGAEIDHGWQWDEVAGVFTPPPPVVPTLTRRQLRLGLRAVGITAGQVDAVIAATPDELQRDNAQIEWADASTYERHHPLVDQIGAAMSLTPEQIDAMWADAAAL